MNSSARATSGAGRDEQAFSLVELLVVVAIVGVIGGIVTSAVVSSLQSAQATNQRIDSTQELEVALQRMARDFRGAREIILNGEPGDPQEAFAFALGADVPTDVEDNAAGSPVAITQEVRYELIFPDGDDEPGRLVRRVDGGQQTLVTLVDVDDQQPIFVYRDREGRIIPCSDSCAKAYLRSPQIEITLTRNLRGRESAVTARTTLFVRSIRYE